MSKTKTTASELADWQDLMAKESSTPFYEKYLLTATELRRLEDVSLELHKAGCDSYEEQQERIAELEAELKGMNNARNRFCSAVNAIANKLGHADKQCYAPEAVVRWAEEKQKRIAELEDGENKWRDEWKVLVVDLEQRIEELEVAEKLLGENTQTLKIVIEKGEQQQKRIEELEERVADLKLELEEEMKVADFEAEESTND